MSVAVPVHALAPGTTLGRYQLLHHLATGGMAEIYLARTQGIEGFEKLVVLKRILPHLAARDEFVAMFLDEARIAATLIHPNVAQVLDVGNDRGNFFFTLELVQGEDTRTLIRRSRGVPLEHALAIAIGAAAGLHAAHRKTTPDGKPMGIVHRDVSPSNLLVSYDGSVKLVDFGIAKAASRHTETRTGTLKGKVHYMSPEQCKGESLDGRSDVFALGIVLYELTCGRRPFVGDSDYAIVTKIVSEDAPRPSTVKKDYPPELEAIVMRALARDRERRFATAEAMQVALEGFVRARRLVVSSVALGGWMRALFADRIEAWRRVLTPRAHARPPTASEANVEIVADEPSAGAGAVSTSMFEALQALAPPSTTPVASTPSAPSRTPAGSRPAAPPRPPVASSSPTASKTPAAPIIARATSVSASPEPPSRPGVAAPEPPDPAAPPTPRNRPRVKAVLAVAGVVLTIVAVVWLVRHPRRSAAAQEPTLSAPAPGPTPVPVAEPVEAARSVETAGTSDGARSVDPSPSPSTLTSTVDSVPAEIRAAAKAAPAPAPDAPSKSRRKRARGALDLDSPLPP